jgi:prepilin-type N-terminal cleavage/methylation domain-containing protein
MLKKLRNKEHGFSLVEISIAVGLMSILLLIGVPAFTGAIGASQNNTAKTTLINVGIILENEKFRNNGIYPSETPVEIRANPEMSKVNIVYGMKRMSFCLIYPSDDGPSFYYKSNSKEPIRSQLNECANASTLP